jgi:hypothetical protein
MTTEGVNHGLLSLAAPGLVSGFVFQLKIGRQGISGNTRLPPVKKGSSTPHGVQGVEVQLYSAMRSRALNMEISGE